LFSAKYDPPFVVFDPLLINEFVFPESVTPDAKLKLNPSDAIPLVPN
jgi:hypothetical protein